MIGIPSGWEEYAAHMMATEASPEHLRDVNGEYWQLYLEVPHDWRVSPKDVH